MLTESQSVLAQSNGEVVDLLAGGQGVFNIVPLGGMVVELDADIIRLGAAAPDRVAPGPSSQSSRAAGE